MKFLCKQKEFWRNVDEIFGSEMPLAGIKCSKKIKNGTTLHVNTGIRTIHVVLLGGDGLRCCGNGDPKRTRSTQYVEVKSQ